MPHHNHHHQPGSSRPRGGPGATTKPTKHRPALYKLSPEQKQQVCAALYSPSLALLLHISRNPSPPPHLRFTLPFLNGDGRMFADADAMIKRAEEAERARIRNLPERLLGRHYREMLVAPTGVCAGGVGCGAVKETFASVLSSVLLGPCGWRSGGGGAGEREAGGERGDGLAAMVSPERYQETLRSRRRGAPQTSKPSTNIARTVPNPRAAIPTSSSQPSFNPAHVDNSSPPPSSSSDSLIPAKTEAHLCDVHFPMCPKMLHAILRLIEKEIGPGLDTIIEIPSYRSPSEIVDIVGRDRVLDGLYVHLKAIYAYWLTPQEYLDVFGPRSHALDPHVVHVENQCDGCIISAIVSLDSNLVHLHAAAQLRVRLEKKMKDGGLPYYQHAGAAHQRTRPAEIVTWVELWMKASVTTRGGGTRYSFEKLVEKSNGIVEKVLSLRRREKIARYLDVCPSPGFPDDLDELAPFNPRRLEYWGRQSVPLEGSVVGSRGRSASRDAGNRPSRSSSTRAQYTRSRQFSPTSTSVTSPEGCPLVVREESATSTPNSEELYDYLYNAVSLPLADPEGYTSPTVTTSIKSPWKQRTAEKQRQGRLRISPTLATTPEEPEFEIPPLTIRKVPVMMMEAQGMQHEHRPTSTSSSELQPEEGLGNQTMVYTMKGALGHVTTDSVNTPAQGPKEAERSWYDASDSEGDDDIIPAEPNAIPTHSEPSMHPEGSMLQPQQRAQSHTQGLSTIPTSLSLDKRLPIERYATRSPRRVHAHGGGHGGISATNVAVSHSETREMPANQQGLGGWE